MYSSYVTRKEIARDLGIDPKTLRRKFQKAGIMLDRGVIPAEKVKEIMLRLEVKSENQDDTEPNEQPDENFNKFDISSLDSQ
jgi:hypothetical protein